MGASDAELRKSKEAYDPMGVCEIASNGGRDRIPQKDVSKATYLVGNAKRAQEADGIVDEVKRKGYRSHFLAAARKATSDTLGVRSLDSPGRDYSSCPFSLAEPSRSKAPIRFGLFGDSNTGRPRTHEAAPILPGGVVSDDTRLQYHFHMLLFACSFRRCYLLLFL
jgi:hypothetical protein